MRAIPGCFRKRKLTEESTETGSACRQVFETAELLQLILSELPAKDLLVHQRTCKLFKTTIAASTALTEQMTFRAHLPRHAYEASGINALIISTKHYRPADRAMMMERAGSYLNRRLTLRTFLENLSFIADHHYRKRPRNALPRMSSFPTTIEETDGFETNIRFDINNEHEARFILANSKGSWSKMSVFPRSSPAILQATVVFSSVISRGRFHRRYIQNCAVQVRMRSATMGEVTNICMKLVINHERLARGRIGGGRLSLGDDNDPEQYSEILLEQRVRLVECLEGESFEKILGQPHYFYSTLTEWRYSWLWLNQDQ